MKNFANADGTGPMLSVMQENALKAVKEGWVEEWDLCGVLSFDSMTVRQEVGYDHNHGRVLGLACRSETLDTVLAELKRMASQADAGEPGDSHWLRPVEIGSIAIPPLLDCWDRCMLHPPTRTRKWACWTALDMEIVSAQNHTSEHVDAGEPGDSHWLRPVEIGSIAIPPLLDCWDRCMLNPPTRTRKWACWTALDMEIVSAQNHTSEHVDAGEPGDSQARGYWV
eukprot:FR737424.1.p1 GENE.FR737424.1~~FR737424.1.p1  ORF type:complete len:240 (+),score=4.03 FR737424.1:47-721(+)